MAMFPYTPPAIAAWLSHISAEAYALQPSSAPTDATLSPQLGDVPTQCLENTTPHDSSNCDCSHPYHLSSCSELGSDISPTPILNSTYRSTLELLVSLPTQFDLDQLFPKLPTRISSAHELSKALPHEATNPLVR